MFDTKIALVVRDDLAAWQKLNVTAFLTSGILGQDSDLIGDPYEDACGNIYAALAVQPVIILSAEAAAIRTIFQRALSRRVRMALYIEDMFHTGHDAANRAAVRQYNPDQMNVVGLGLRESRNVVDRIVKGARMHA